MTEQTQELAQDLAVEFDGIEFDTPLAEPEAAPKVVEQQEPEPAVEDPDQTEAKARGWTTKDEWVKAGKNPDDWVNAKHFNEKGRLISQARQFQDLQKTFDKRLQGVQTLYKAQINSLQQQNQSLQQARDEAIQYGDVAKVKQLDQQIMTNAVEQLQVQQAQETTTANVVDQAELEREAAWEKSNPWVSINDPLSPEFNKAIYARQLYQNLLTQGVPVDERLATLERELAVKFPKVNQNRDAAAITDGKTAVKQGGKLTMADLTPSEKADWKSFGKEFFSNESEFLQAVADARKAGG